MALPSNGHSLASGPRLDHNFVGRRNEEAFADFEDMVVHIALAGEPHAAAQDRKLTGQALDTHRGVEFQGRGTCLGEKLRFHHQSPGWLQPAFSLHRLTMFGDSQGLLQ